jgi:hypothetical protein
MSLKVLFLLLNALEGCPPSMRMSVSFRTCVYVAVAEAAAAKMLLRGAAVNGCSLIRMCSLLRMCSLIRMSVAGNSANCFVPVGPAIGE